MSFDYLVRPYKEGDEEKIVQLLEIGFRTWPSVYLNASKLDHWKWKYDTNTGLLAVAESGNEIVGSNHRIIKRAKILDKNGNTDRTSLYIQTTVKRVYVGA